MKLIKKTDDYGNEYYEEILETEEEIKASITKTRRTTKTKRKKGIISVIITLILVIISMIIAFNNNINPLGENSAFYEYIILLVCIGAFEESVRYLKKH